VIFNFIKIKIMKIYGFTVLIDRSDIFSKGITSGAIAGACLPGL
jgi:hypothetical protein